MQKTTIRHAEPADMEAVRALCWDYRAFLRSLPGEDGAAVTAVYSRPYYTDLMARLEEVHARPSGAILVAVRDGAIVGCGMSQQFSPGIAELKRIFVSETARGTGMGRQLTEALLEQVRRDGYERVFLDTGRLLTSARGLYASLGFRECAPYHDGAGKLTPYLRFFELTL